MYFFTKQFTESDIPVYIKGLRSDNLKVRKFSIRDLESQFEPIEIVEEFGITKVESNYDYSKLPSQQESEIAKWEDWWNQEKGKINTLFKKGRVMRQLVDIELNTTKKLKELKWEISLLRYESYDEAQIENIVRITGKDSMGYNPNATGKELLKAVNKWETWFKENKNYLSWDIEKEVLVYRKDNIEKRLNGKMVYLEGKVADLGREQYSFEAVAERINKMVDEKIVKQCPYPADKRPSMEERIKVMKWWLKWLKENKERLFWDTEKDVIGVK